MADDFKRFQPQPGPQSTFLGNPADICIYGGGAGGGKTFALLMDPLRRRTLPFFGAVLFRRTVPDIRNEGGLWDTSTKVYPHLGGTPISHVLEWRWTGGFRVSMRHLEREDTVMNWQGAQVPWIGFDELTHFTEKQFVYMLSRSRSVFRTAPARIRATTNADARSWVRKWVDWWIDPDTGFAIPERSGVIRWTGMAGEERVWRNTRAGIERMLGPNSALSVAFVPAKLTDNPALMDADPTYLAKLRALNRVDRERLENANWNIVTTGGSLFRREWFPVEDEMPRRFRRVIRYWDLAATRPTPQNPDPDWTRGMKIGMDESGRLWVLSVVSRRDTPAAIEELFRSTAQQDGPTVEQWVEHDPGQAGKAQASHWIRAFPHLNLRFTEVPKTAKEARAKRVSPQCELKNVILARADWTEGFLNELTEFPNGAHDEFVDTLSGGWAVLSSTMTIRTRDIEAGLVEEEVRSLDG